MTVDMKIFCSCTIVNVERVQCCRKIAPQSGLVLKNELGNSQRTSRIIHNCRTYRLNRLLLGIREQDLQTKKPFQNHNKDDEGSGNAQSRELRQTSRNMENNVTSMITTSMSVIKKTWKNYKAVVFPFFNKIPYVHSVLYRGYYTGGSEIIFNVSSTATETVFLREWGELKREWDKEGVRCYDRQCDILEYCSK